MPGIVKIGKTNELNNRVKDLSRATGVPLPFEVFYACEVRDMDFVEKQLHDAFANNRINPNREFFKIQPERVLAALKIAEIIKDITPEEDIIENVEEGKALNKIKETQGNFNFEILGIKPGSVLTFTRDSTITCTVIDKKNIKFKDIQTSLSQAARIALEDHDGKTRKWSVAGPLYWEYEGEVLDDIRIKALNN